MSSENLTMDPKKGQVVNEEQKAERFVPIETEEQKAAPSLTAEGGEIKSRVYWTSKKREGGGYSMFINLAIVVVTPTPFLRIKI